MNNPIRALVQRRFEASQLLRMGGAIPRAKVLEIGGGRGVGAEIIFDRFSASHVDAFDLDPRMVSRAKHRLAERGDDYRCWVGDAARIAAPDEAYDAVFDFGIIHHVPDWRDVLSEAYRVMRPGGLLYAEEVLAAFIQNPVVRHLLEHPQTDRFDAPTFRQAVADAGFEPKSWQDSWGCFTWIVASKPRA